ncbi:MAG: hypothetical protein HYS77_16980, partial [Candidatus Rokubacteria bacterium]|nr:hypothetical protein [Candidatus Rokubacteria bacterium]
MLLAGLRDNGVRPMTSLVAVVLGLVLMLGGCAVHMTPPLEPKLAPILAREKLPLRVALLITEEDSAKRFKDSFFDGVKTVETELGLGRALQDTLALSFTQIFDRVTVVRTPPRTSGGYHAVLVPRILGGRWEYSVRFTGADVRYVVSGSLTARDQIGNELLVVKEDGQAASFLAAGIGEPGFGSVVSQAIGDLVRKWGEQMAASLQMQQYASRFPPAVAASGAAAGRPPGSEITISLSHPIEGARVAEEMIAVAGLV